MLKPHLLTAEVPRSHWTIRLALAEQQGDDEKTISASVLPFKPQGPIRKHRKRPTPMKSTQSRSASVRRQVLETLMGVSWKWGGDGGRNEPISLKNQSQRARTRPMVSKWHLSTHFWWALVQFQQQSWETMSWPHIWRVTARPQIRTHFWAGLPSFDFLHFLEETYDKICRDESCSQKETDPIVSNLWFKWFLDY